MIKTIWKYPLKATDSQNISMPKGSQILTVQTQFDVPCLWALVDPAEKNTEARLIETFGTGHDLHYDMGASREYIGTFQLHEGQLVFHVFEYTGI